MIAGTASVIARPANIRAEHQVEALVAGGGDRLGPAAHVLGIEPPMRGAGHYRFLTHRPELADLLESLV